MFFFGLTTGATPIGRGASSFSRAVEERVAFLLFQGDHRPTDVGDPIRLLGDAFSSIPTGNLKKNERKSIQWRPPRPRGGPWTPREVVCRKS